MEKISKRRRQMGEEAWAEYQRRRQNLKAAHWKEKNVLQVMEWRRRTKRKLIEYKGGKCEVCGYNKNCPGAYDFHHLDPTKKNFNISRNMTKSIEMLKHEVDKCKLLCKNCHAETHNEDYKNRTEKRVIKYNINKLKDVDKQINLDIKELKVYRPRVLQSVVERECSCCHAKTYNKFYCSGKCSALDNRKVNRPDKETLHKLLWEKSTVQIAKQYGVSDKAVAKWAKSYGIDKPPRGYWGFLRRSVREVMS